MVSLQLALEFFDFFKTINTIQGIIFILGLLFLVIEVFSPGFGVAGGVGVLLLVVGIIMTARSLMEALAMFAILLVLLAILIVIVYRSAKKGKLSKKLILWQAAKREDGFSATEDASALVGQEGVALTVLRPSGTGEFAGRRLDIVTDGDFIERGTKIKIVRTEGRRIVVKPVE
ncbi:MAG: NfeD family protein [Eubacteriales bacterium]|nr:NfeD family protein [Eubacteriales bacterium]